jgi:diguanylate cyclase (GGDEF)-like protein
LERRLGYSMSMLHGSDLRQLWTQAPDQVELTALKAALAGRTESAFKQVNDVMGHQAGDALLKEMARRLSRLVSGDDTFARIGGDEFVVLLETVSDRAGVSQVLARLMALVRQPIVIDTIPVAIGCSFGVSWYPVHGTDTESLLRDVDFAMYRNKRVGRISDATVVRHDGRAIDPFRPWHTSRGQSRGLGRFGAVHLNKRLSRSPCVRGGTGTGAKCSVVSRIPGSASPAHHSRTWTLP